MRIAIGSDIHLEFGDYRIKNIEGADVLVLAGDITTTNHIEQHLDFFKQCSQQFGRVIYVLGNHEHYHGDVLETKNIISDKLSRFLNIDVFEQGNIFLDHLDAAFFVGTMWTDINKGNPLIVEYIRRGMNDFHVIKNLTSDLMIIKHNAFLKFVSDCIRDYRARNDTRKLIVVTHHAPSFHSIHERFQNLSSATMNFAFASADEDFIINHPEISLWIHGHMHDAFDYTIGNTRVLCNPRGYFGYEKNASKYHLQYIDV